MPLRYRHGALYFKKTRIAHIICKADCAINLIQYNKNGKEKGQDVLGGKLVYKFRMSKDICFSKSNHSIFNVTEESFTSCISDVK